MKRKNIIRIVTATCMAAFLALTLSSCAAQDTAKDQQASNRTYMAQVNRIMEDISNGLVSFSDAVSRGDLVSMKTQADSAFKGLDDLKALEVPEDTKDIQTDYVDGCNTLRSALNSYIELYSEIENATEAAPFDYTTYDSRLKEVQQKYDEGLAKLESGDKLATEKS